MSSAIGRLERNARRTAEIGAVLVRYGLADWLRKIPGSGIKEWLRDPEGHAISELSAPERIRLALTALGTTFIKVGQLLSTRPDLIGHELARELGKLQTQTVPDPPATAEATVEKELGERPEKLFAHFEPESFASASIAQVHYAKLLSGEEVVVKIQKEGIEAAIEADLSILADLAQLAEKHVTEVKPYRPVAVVRQITRTLRDELDFTRERRNMEEFRRYFADDETVRFARPWPEFSSRRVLTMERMSGVLISDTVALRALGVDLDDFAKRGANMYLEMIFRDSFYHADPHPGNLMVLAAEVVGVLDCGMVQRLDASLREQIEDVLLAVAHGDAETLADIVWSLARTPPAGQREQLKVELAELVADYAGRSISELQLGEALTTITDIIHRNHIFLPSGVSLLLRTLIELEGTAQLLSPSFSLAELIEPYCERALRRRYSPGRVAQRLERSSRDWGRLFEALPRDVTEIVQRFRAGTLTVHLEHRRLDPVVNRLVMGLLTSSLFLGSSILWSANAPPLVEGVSLFGAVGYALSLLMGFRLMRAIRRSEHIGEDV